MVKRINHFELISKSNLTPFLNQRELFNKRKKSLRFPRVRSFALGTCHVPALSSDRRIAPTLCRTVHRRVIIVDESNCSQELGSSFSSTYRDKSKLSKLARSLANI